MEYIIVWRSNGYTPHIDLDERGFKEKFSSLEDAKEKAERVRKHYNYEIFQKVES